MASRAFKVKLGEWQVLYDNLTPRLPDMPHLTTDHTSLATVLGQARDLENRQELANSALRDVNQQRRDILQEGNDLQSRLSSGLRGSLGSKSEKLIEFGVKPRPRKARRRSSKSATDGGSGNGTGTTPTPSPPQSTDAPKP